MHAVQGWGVAGKLHDVNVTNLKSEMMCILSSTCMTIYHIVLGRSFQLKHPYFKLVTGL